MTTTTLQGANDVLRSAVASRMAATPPDDDKMIGYREPEPRRFYGSTEEPQPRSDTYAEWEPGFRGDSLMRDESHPTSKAFYDLRDRLKATHAGKSKDYGCPSGTDPLANIRNGAKFVGIPEWKAAMVRLSDKVTRLGTFNATGRLEYEGVEDTLLDLASYSLLALLLYREEVAK